VNVEAIIGFLYSIYIMFIHKTYVKFEGEDTEVMFDSALELILAGLLKKQS
jgi:hypothetical protein